MALRVSIFIGAVYLAIELLTWRPRLRRHVRALYSQHPHTLLLGSHTLELRPDGLVSAGPQHTTFRSWAAVTGLIQSPSHLLLPTVYGNVYVLPLRAVSDTPATIGFIREHLPASQDAT